MEGIWFRKSTRGSYGVLRGELMECGWRKKYCGGGEAGRIHGRHATASQ